MEPFTTFCAVAVPIDIANCDTDQIIPARFLRRHWTDPDYDKFLLHDHRFGEDGNEKDFAFNRDAFRAGRIFVADVNWGCGSSREDAARVLVANGVRAVIAPSFGDIHYANCVRNGILPIRLASDDCAALRRQLNDNPGAEIAIDLETQSVTGPDQARYEFAIAAAEKHRLLNGLDDIAVTMEYAEAIDAFETGHKARLDWAY